MIDDPEVVRVSPGTAAPPGTHRAATGVPQYFGWTDVHADDLNSRFKELVGEDYSVKDLRTCTARCWGRQRSSTRTRR